MKIGPLESISAVATGFIFGSALLYASSVFAQEERRPMPGLIGGNVEIGYIKGPREDRSGRRIGQIVIETRTLMEGGTTQISYHLICSGTTEETPFAVFVSENPSSGGSDSTLYKDHNRDRIVDPDGTIEGDDVTDHYSSRNIPRCPTK